ncbi:MAG: hypothetical protein MUO53_05160 [Maribacter sp.]|nr:hypothetical protein [Maribacter sp.]
MNTRKMIFAVVASIALMASSFAMTQSTDDNQTHVPGIDKKKLVDKI